MTVDVTPDLLDRLAPMHLAFDAADRVTRVGRTLARIAPCGVGRPLAEVIEPVQPALPPTAAALLGQVGRRLRLRLVDEHGSHDAPTRLRAVVHPAGAGGGLLLLCFGAEIAQGVARHGLGASDFAELDPTIEILFLLEMQRALLDQHGSFASRLAEAGARAERDALTDALTGLPNRRGLEKQLTGLSRAADPVYGLMQVDLDRFKAVNDTLGHAAGDHVLAQVGAILREELRDGDTVARVGGDEFLLLIRGCDDFDLLRAIAARLIDRISEPMRWHGVQCRISCSIGAGLSRSYASPSPARLVRDVDAALYRAKGSGRARFVIAMPGDAAGTEPFGA
jgi:diguanylate cyclase (GGDEF)-like protein